MNPWLFFRSGKLRTTTAHQPRATNNDHRADREQQRKRYLDPRRV
jgi:hypothetical protein